MSGGADISECRLYRYRLWRYLKEDGGTTCCFVMLNSSTADAEHNDPTIRRCIYFAEREGHGLLIVVNMYAWRTSSPKELEEASSFGHDIIGPDNDVFLRSEIGASELIIVGWGAYPNLRHRDVDIALMAEAASKPLYCLGTTKAGHPRHPLYLRKDTPLEIWNRR